MVTHWQNANNELVEIKSMSDDDLNNAYDLVYMNKPTEFTFYHIEREVGVGDKVVRYHTNDLFSVHMACWKAVESALWEEMARRWGVVKGNQG